MPITPEEQALVELLRQGDAGAQRQVVEKYLDHLLALARRRIGARMSSRVDPEDVALSALRTVLFRVKDGRLVVEDEDDLCKLLVTITAHKALRRVAFHKAAKRDPNKETAQGTCHQEQLLSLFDGEPGPQEQAAFNDQLEHFLSRLTPVEQQIIEMRMLGHSNKDIVEKLDLKYDRKIRRLVDNIQYIAKKMGLLADVHTA